MYLWGGNNTTANDVAYTLFTKSAWNYLGAHVGGSASSNRVDFESQEVSANTWHTVVYTIDLQENTFSVTLDGDTIAADKSARMAVSTLKTLRVYEADNGDSSVKFKSISVTATRNPYDVWFDGTDGMEQLVHKNYNGSTTYHPALPTYYQGATDTHESVPVKANGTATVTLPTEAGSPTQYSYTLNGWYDVVNKHYYKPGEAATITGNTVFYADWVPASYDFGGKNNRATVTDQPDTSDFITTHLFDYNELFNLHSSETYTENRRPVISADTHREFWVLQPYDKTYLNFTFLNWAYQNATGNRTLGAVESLDTKNNSQSGITQKILTDSTGTLTQQGTDILAALFTQNNDLGRTYVGEGDYLYQYDSAPNSTTYGYYYYDSAKNGASYNKSKQCFTLYQQPEYVQKQDLSNNTWTSNSNRPSAFLPFNDNESGIYNEKDGSINYWFGMQSSIDFWLPNDSGTNGNIADTGKPMEFRFSGDDDVWVFVDDTLVLDLGGIHGKADGTINFSTGKVTTAGVESDLPQFTAGNHTLTIYYLERGSSESNCSIYFNIAPKYSLSIQKTDAADSSTLLPGAVFGVYTDAACTQPAQLWDSAADESANPNDSHNKFTTDTAGAANCYGLVAGNTYYVKELKAPDGYNASNDVYTIALDNGGNVTPVEGVLGADATGKKITLTVKNEKIKQPDKPENTATPTPAPGTTSTPTPSATPAPAMATPTVTQTPGSGTTTTVPGTAAAPTAQVTSAIPQTEDTSHPLLLCILCIAGAFGFGVLYAKLTLWRKQ